ncbi:hypothetical protein ACFVSW_00320 [Neobacillus sp. NPDC058068]
MTHRDTKGGQKEENNNKKENKKQQQEQKAFHPILQGKPMNSF